MRRVRGDGSCFYRSLGFVLAERLVQFPELAESFLKLTSTFKGRLLKLGYPEMTTEDFCDVVSFSNTLFFKPSLFKVYFFKFCETVSQFKSEQEVVDTFNDDGRSNYLVVFMRYILYNLEICDEMGIRIVRIPNTFGIRFELKLIFVKIYQKMSSSLDTV